MPTFAATHLVGSDSSTETAREIRSAAKSAGLFEAYPAHPSKTTCQLNWHYASLRETLAAANPNNMDSVFGPSAGGSGGVTGALAHVILEPLLAGDKRASFGFTEPDNVQPTHGQITGEQLIVNGQKSYVTGGADADFINCLVHIEERGPSMVVIDTNIDGVILEKKFVSLDGSHHAAFRFENVTVPSHHIIGEPGQGHQSHAPNRRYAFVIRRSGQRLYAVDP